MSNYKFNSDKKTPTDDEINQKKDFDKLIYNYNKATKPLYKVKLPNYKNRYYLLAIIIILALVYILVDVLKK